MEVNRRDFLAWIGIPVVAGLVAWQNPLRGAWGWPHPAGVDVGSGPATLFSAMAETIDPFDAAVGQRLKKAREGRKLTQDDAARWLGVSQASVSAYEKGATSPNPRQLYELCRLYGVQADVVLGLREATRDRDQKS